jgi:molybdate transport system substrate-binding protein
MAARRLAFDGHQIVCRAYATFGIVLMMCATASSDEIRLFSGGAPQQVLRLLTSEFEKELGHKANSTYALVTVIQQKLAPGEKADLVLLPLPLIAAVERTVAMRDQGRGTLARVGIGVIIREGAVQPDISSADAIRRLLSGAHAIAFPEPSTPSSAHLGRMIEQLGIADAVRPKIMIKAAIDGGGELVANGMADVGMYLPSEVQSIKGVVVAGLLPAPVQSYVVYASAIPA